MGILKAFDNAFQKKRERGWEKIYVFVDIHETILKPTYTDSSEKCFYKLAKETLQILSNRKDISLGLYTCSYPEEIQDYLEYFIENGIHFEHINSNLEEGNNKYACFSEKPYFNVLLDDKAGFDPEEDWRKIEVNLKHNTTFK